MDALLLITFVLGYLAIVFEHPLKINKTAPALLTAVICWSIFILLPPSADFSSNVHWTQFIDGLKLKQIDLSVFSTEQLFQKFVSAELAHHLSKTAEILFFLLGAMTIVELVDAHQGFKVITNRIRTKDASSLLIIISVVTFFLSSVLDNLTTAIVMVSLLRKLVHDVQQRKLFAGMVIIAANAGGAWSPIGDVTTTMLWIGGQITAGHLIQSTFIASVVCLAVPLAVMATQLKGTVTRAAYDYDAADEAEVVKGSRIMLFLGVGALIFVPIFKSVTHLPPYLGILLGLAVLWVASEWIHIDKDEEEKKPYSAIHALSKIDTSSVLFFLGILLAISALESAHILTHVAQWLDSTLGNMKLIVFIIGLLSAVVDNVPLVAASMGMYDMSVYPTDHWMWAFMAYCAGTGGSALIIGSAAGVAVMGMEKIDFMWYAKKISLYALMGYIAGAAVYLLTYQWFG
ncbi:MAG: sodium:proton antiporter [Bacteroidetes bacterium]|nr:sodium:proton antiporter [Bacteroidota bacterium]